MYISMVKSVAYKNVFWYGTDVLRCEPQMVFEYQEGQVELVL